MTLLFWRFCLPSLILPGRGDLLSKLPAASLRLCFQGNPIKYTFNKPGAVGAPRYLRTHSSFMGYTKSTSGKGQDPNPDSDSRAQVHPLLETELAARTRALPLNIPRIQLAHGLQTQTLPGSRQLMLICDSGWDREPRGV